MKPRPFFSWEAIFKMPRSGKSSASSRARSQLLRPKNPPKAKVLIGSELQIPRGSSEASKQKVTRWM